MRTDGPTRDRAATARSTLLTALWTLVLAIATGCAHDFPRPETHAFTGADSDPDGNALFDATFAAHGGERLSDLGELTVELEGDWPFWLPRIQPLVADAGYRVRSTERLRPNEGRYEADYEGPSGTKRVRRTRESIRVVYNGEESTDPDILASTAMTADSYIYFLLGPLALAHQHGQFTRLSDTEEGGRRYHRLYTVLEPGVGLSQRDELVLWVDAETKRSFRVHFTLEGFERTKGAHVDTTFLEYRDVDGFVLPTVFHERVRAPLALDAHGWWITKAGTTPTASR